MKTAMQELKETLEIEADRLKDAVHGTDQYGYKGAMKNIIKDIDAQMLAKEKQQIIDAVKSSNGTGFGNITIHVSDEIAEDYYNETFKQ